MTAAVQEKPAAETPPAGVVAAGAGLVVYLTAPKSTSVGLVVSPTPLPGGGGATMQASF